MNHKKQKTKEITNSSRQRSAFPIVETMGNAAALIGVPESLLKSAKRKGCKAFITGNRVDLGILIPFLFGMLTGGNDIPDGFASWKEVLESEKAKRETIKRQADEKSVMPIEDILKINGEALVFLFAELERLCNELPPALAGCTAVEAHTQLESFKEQLRRNLQKKFEVQ